MSKRSELVMAHQLSLAISIASAAHNRQLDRSEQPYILHPLKVMHDLLTEYPGDFELAAVGVLHDVIEDHAKHGFTAEYLLNRGLTQRIVDGVLSVTKLDGQSEEDYIQGVKANFDGVRVKLKDLKHNSDIRRLKGLTQKDFDRTVKYQRMFVDLMEVVKSLSH